MSTTSYFSNHSSQSRFLAISGASSSSSSAVSTSTGSAPSSAPTTSSNAPGGHVAVKRAPSKHFSTSVAAAVDKDKDKGRAVTEEDDDENAYGGGVPRSVHPLRNTWVFWFRQQRSPGNKILSYEEGIKRVAAFSSVESFWALHTHLAPPSQLTPTADYLCFMLCVFQLYLFVIHGLLSSRNLPRTIPLPGYHPFMPSFLRAISTCSSLALFRADHSRDLLTSSLVPVTNFTRAPPPFRLTPWSTTNHIPLSNNQVVT
ncbi:hypothetical protein DFH06DRAFT_1325071 [Mycena polygramma]|nr:hypothetical protein DFH06DRAFT_1325071 [Mycena polygramma]